MTFIKCEICQKTDNLKACSACGQIFYCNVEHQKEHWKEHKKNCKAYHIIENHMGRKCLKASREIKADSLIFSENPLIIGPDWSYDLFSSASTLNCVGCFEPIKMLNYRCKVCMWPCCNENCIGLHNEKLHGIECAFLKGGLGVKNNNLREYYRTDVLFALKCLLMQLHSSKKFEQLMQLDGHVDARKDTENYIESEKHIDYLEENFLIPLKEAEKKANKIILPLKSRETLRKIYGIIETNAMFLTNNNEIAGLYSAGCMMQHSCLPNCLFSYDKKNQFKLIVRAARDIRKGEEITTCYGNILWGTQARKEQLLKMKYFTCECERCSDPTEFGTNFSSLKCIGMEFMSDCDGMQMPKKTSDGSDIEFVCDKCPAHVKKKEISDLMAKMSDEVDHVMQTEATVPALETLMEKLATFLHPNHYHLFALKHALIQLYGNHRDFPTESMSLSNLKRKLQFCEELLATIGKLDPHNVRLSIYTAVVLYEKSNTIAEMQRRQLENDSYSKINLMKCLQRAQMILKNDFDSMQGKQLNMKVSNALKKLNEDDKKFLI